MSAARLPAVQGRHQVRAPGLDFLKARLQPGGAQEVGQDAGHQGLAAGWILAGRADEGTEQLDGLVGVDAREHSLFRRGHRGSPGSAGR